MAWTIENFVYSNACCFVQGCMHVSHGGCGSGCGFANNKDYISSWGMKLHLLIIIVDDNKVPSLPQAATLLT